MRSIGSKQVAKTASAAASVFALTPILALGPSLQDAVVSAIGGEQTSLYAVRYGSALAQFPDFTDRLQDAFHPVFFCASAAIILACYRSSNARQYASRCAVAVFSVWMLIDIAFGLLAGQLSLTQTLVNAVANAAGAALLAVGLVITAYWTHLIRRRFRQSDATAGLLSVLTVLALGLLVFAAVDIAEKTVYRPVGSSISARISTPVQAVYDSKAKSTRETEGAVENGQSDRFEVLGGAHRSVDELRFIGRTKGFRLSLSNAVEERSFAPVARIYVVDGCGTVESALSALESGGHAQQVEFAGLSAIEITMDDGFSDIQIAPGTSKFGEVSVAQETGTRFWIKPAGDAGRAEVGRFIAESTSVEAGLWGPEVGILVAPHLFDVESPESGVRSVERRVSVVAGRNQLQLGFKLDGVRMGNEPVSCRIVDQAGLTMLGDGSLEVSSVIRPGVLLEVDAPERPLASSLNDGAVFKASGISGWLSAFPDGTVAVSELVQSGKLAFFVGTVSMEYLSVDDVVDERTGESSIQIVGDLYGSIDRMGALNIRGVADVLYVDGVSRVRTRWEKFGWDIQYALILSLVAGLGLIGRYAWRVVSDNRSVH